jgi:PleD family two-component response regulator
MPNTRRAPHPKPLILVATPNRWERQELADALTRHGFRATAVQDEAELLEQTHSHPPDAFVLSADIAGLALCSTLRNFSVATPIILIASSTVTPTQEHDAFRAGAWAVIETPVDTDGLLLRLEVFVQPKRELERVSEECLVDKVSGLYNPAGLARRAAELAALATRQGLALACAVFRPLAHLPNHLAGDRLALAFRSVGRVSDALGRTGPTEFAVFAPATNTWAAARLVRRMIDNVERAFGNLREGNKKVGVCAGYSTAHAAHRIVPDVLLAQARSALEKAG